MPTIFLAALLTLASALGGELHTFGRRQALDVEVRSTAGEPQSGVTVRLCRSSSGTKLPDLGRETCRTQLTDAEGSCLFSSVRPGEYALIGELEGFASTVVFPLPIAGPRQRGETPDASPIAPDQVALVLNPVCWDC